MPLRMQTIAGLFDRARVAITNTLNNAEIKVLVAVFGYDDKETANGKKLYEEAVRTRALQASLAGAQLAKSRELAAARKAAVDACQSLTSVIRAAWFGNRTALARLGVTGRFPRATAAFIDAGMKLFDNVLINSDIKATLETRSYAPAKLAAEKAKVMAYANLDSQQESAKGAAQQAALDAAKARRMLEVWLNSYVRVAKVALKDKPELAEKLGILHRASKPKAG